MYLNGILKRPIRLNWKEYKITIILQKTVQMPLYRFFMPSNFERMEIPL